jgi:hypothetical protein
MTSKPLLALLLPLFAACGAPSVVPPPLPAPLASASAPPRHLVGPRWFAAATHTVERTTNVERLVASGTRFERPVGALAAGPVTPVGSSSHRLAGGIPAPAWVAASERQYLFWGERALFAAASFDGELVPVGVVPSRVRDVSPWLDGWWVRTESGAFVVRGKGAPTHAPAPAARAASAIDARRGAYADVFGRVLATADGGATFADLGARLGVVSRVSAVEGSLVVGSDPPRVLDGLAVLDGRAPSPAWEAGDVTGWDERVEGTLPEAVFRGGIEEGGRVLAVGNASVAWVEWPSLRVAWKHPLPESVTELECRGVSLPEGPYLACASSTRAALVGVTSRPSVERTFARRWSGHDAAFVAVEGEAVAYLGECLGQGESEGESDDDNDRYDDWGTELAPRSICLRVRSDEWIDVRASGRVLGWVPHRAGRATVIAQSGEQAPTVVTHPPGAVRVVGVKEQDWSPAPSGWSRPLDVHLRPTPSGDVEGWFVHRHGGGRAPGVLRANGTFEPFATPLTFSDASWWGRWAVGEADRGVFVTSDGGRSWRSAGSPLVNEPYGGTLDCGPAGFRHDSLWRLGWDEGPAPERVAPSEIASARAGAAAPPESTPEPLARLVCAFAGEAAGEQTKGGWQAFGTRSLGTGRWRPLGWSGALTTDSSSTGEVAWVPMLDPQGALRRVALSLGSKNDWSTVPLGYVLAADGRIDAAPHESEQQCPADSLHRAGVTRWMGGCLPPERTRHSSRIASVGIDLGGEAWFATNTRRGLSIDIASGWTAPKVPPAPKPPKPIAPAPPASAAVAPTAKPATSTAPLSTPPSLPPSGPAASSRASLRHLTSLPLTWDPTVVSVGARAASRGGAQPFLVVVGDSGAAAAYPIDRRTGSLGMPERLAPLDGLTLGVRPECAARPDDLRALVAITFHVGVDVAQLPQLGSPGTQGLLALRWSATRVCVDAFDIAVRDERTGTNGPGAYDYGTHLQKLYASTRGGVLEGRFVSILPGRELSQPVVCR